MVPRLVGVRGFLVLIGVTFVLACASRLGPGIQGTTDLSGGGAAVEMTYLGAGGWVMDLDGEQVLAAPFFSNPSLLQTGLQAIEADTAAVDRFMAPYDVSAARVILIGHGHYDHAMDVPRVAGSHAAEARILANRTTANLFGTWSGLADRLDVTNGFEGDEERAGEWFLYGPRVRVMPLKSRHGPHFEGLTLFQGTADAMRQTPPRHAGEWLDGETVAFLIDFLDDESRVRYRIYYQDAVAAAPWGLAPRSLVDADPVDLAILVPATFDQVEWHPEALIDNLRPARVLLGHWEDFFVPFDAPKHSVLLSDMRHFERRLGQVFEGPWWRPDIGSVFRFPVNRPGG